LWYLKYLNFGYSNNSTDPTELLVLKAIQHTQSDNTSMLKAIIKGNRLVNKINIEHYKGHFLVSYKMKKKVEINRDTENKKK